MDAVAFTWAWPEVPRFWAAQERLCSSIDQSQRLSDKAKKMCLEGASPKYLLHALRILGIDEWHYGMLDLGRAWGCVASITLTWLYQDMYRRLWLGDCLPSQLWLENFPHTAVGSEIYVKGLGEGILDHWGDFDGHTEAWGLLTLPSRGQHMIIVNWVTDDWSLSAEDIERLVPASRDLRTVHSVGKTGLWFYSGVSYPPSYPIYGNCSPAPARDYPTALQESLLSYP